MRILVLPLLILAMAFAIGEAAAQSPRPPTPTALVEEAPVGSGVEHMDYVAPGRSIRLGAGQRLVLGYVRSCLREVIVGGAVTVGEFRSDIEGGTVQRELVECDGGRLRLSPAQSKTGAAVVFRDPVGGERKLPASRITLHGRAPLVELPRAATLTIERLDAPGAAFRITASASDLARGRFLDLATRGVELAPGGLYRAQAADRSVVFRVASTAEPGASPLLGRLLRL